MNRTLLWLTLLFVLFAVAYPAVQLMIDARPMPVAVRDYFKLGPDLQGGTRLVYGVDYLDTAVSTDQVTRVLTDRIDPAGTKNYIIRPRAGGGRLEVLMAGADAREVEAVKNLVTRTGYLTFRICADPDDVPNYQKIAEDRLKGIAPPAEYKWIPLQWNSKANWARVADFLFGRVGRGQEQISRQEALEHFVDFSRLGAPGGASIIYVIHETAGSGFVQTGTLVIGREEPGESPEGELAEPAPEGQSGAESQPAAEGEAAPLRRPVEVADVEILVLDNVPIVEGRDFSSTRKSQDIETQSPVILFDMRGDADAQNRLAELTGKHVGDRMGIVLDGKMQSAPTIQDKLRQGGRITGYRTPEERDAVLAVLQSGTLDVEMQLLWEGTVGPELGKDNIRRGLTASLVSLVCVVVFMGVYYLLAGVIADMAMLANLLIVILIMHWMQGTWTLPGIAGLILTVGMSVDANVLIFERIREELSRGGSIRLAVRNGYSRAMPAIIDGNLTTFFTAVILAWVGSPEVQGFAIVLMIGLAASMFTALLFTRSIFELLIQSGLLRRLPMLRLFHATGIRFSQVARGVFVISMVAVVAGIGLSIGTGDDKYAMEFRGGTQVEFELKEPVPIDEVRRRLARLDEGFLVALTLPEPIELETVQEKVEALGPGYQDAIATTFGAPDAEGLHRNFEVQVFTADAGPAAKTMASALGAEGEPSVRSAAAQGFGYASAVVQPVTYAGERAREDRYIVQVLLADDVKVKQSILGLFRDVVRRGGEVKVNLASRVLSAADVLEMQGAAETETPPETPEAKEPEKTDEEAKGDEEVVEVAARPILPDYQKYVGAYQATVELVGKSLVPSEVAVRIDRYLDEQAPDKAPVTREIIPTVTDPAAPTNATEFMVYVYDRRFDADDPKVVRNAQLSWDAALERAIEDPPPLSSSKVDPRIGDESWHQALIAIALSLVIIIAYIWFRFARISYGLAAVVALIHDVAIAMGLVLVFSWFGKNIPFIGEMKIDLPMIGAFLTLIGYSLNDTIVVFDRIRENRGKFGELSESVVNGSINQTLSRTVLTSFTTWIVVVILYFFGGVQSSIHGFAFVLSIGVIVGTYSSIFIASPLLLWLRKSKRAAARGV